MSELVYYTEKNLFSKRNVSSSDGAFWRTNINSETKNQTIKTWSTQRYELTVSFQIPVHVENIGTEDEEIIYNSNSMILNKTYEVTYKGEKWVLQKTDNDIKFYKSKTKT